MPFAENFMLQGSISFGGTIPGNINVNTGFLPSKIQIIDQTQFGNASGNLGIQQIFWDSAQSNQTNVYYINTGGTAVIPGQYLAANGSYVSQYDGHAASPQQLLLGPKIAGTTYAKSTGTFTITSSATLYPGAVVLITNGTSGTKLSSVDPSLGGQFFTVNTVPLSTTFTIANSSNWLNTASFTGGSQTFNVQLVTVGALYYPTLTRVMFISQANPAVVTTNVNSNLTVGQQVKLNVPKYFGMTQANGLTGIVSAVNGNQVTLGGSISINSTAFTAFSWNNGVAGTSAVPYTPATMVPMGSGPSVASGPPTVTYNVDVLDDATDNQGFQGFTLGSSLLVAATNSVVGFGVSDILTWTAWRGDV